MSKLIQFGEDVEGFQVPVLNEREIRASAGIMFLIAFTSVTFIFLYRNLVAQRKLTEMKNDFISNIPRIKNAIGYGECGG